MCAQLKAAGFSDVTMLSKACQPERRRRDRGWWRPERQDQSVGTGVFESG